MEKDILFYQEQTKEIVSIIEKSTPLAKNVRGSVSDFCPNIVYITIDALEVNEYPHNIAENSIYLRFCIDFNKNKFECKGSGHVYLSPKDLKTEKHKYMCMRSMINIAEEKGIKKMRKSNHKDNKTTATKIASYFNEIMNALVEYTGGYPYKQGIEE